MRLQLDTALTGAGIEGSGDASQTAAAGSSRAGSSGTSRNASAADSIQISGPSSALQRLSADRTARLQQLTAMVQGGSYQVSAGNVSRAMVDYAVSGTE